MRTPGVKLVLEAVLATGLFFPGFIIGWGTYPPAAYVPVLALIVILYLLVIKMVPRLVGVALSVPIIALQLVSVVTYALYGLPFEYGTFVILQNADMADIREFLPLIRPGLAALIAASCVAYGAGLWWFLGSDIRFDSARRRIYGVVAIALVIPGLDYVHKSRFDTYSYIHLYRLAFTYAAWRDEIDEAARSRASRFHFEGRDPVALDGAGPLDDIVIIVIGESLRRGQMGLYGYGRDTTPLLDGRRDRLIVFERAISPANSSVLSLGYMFTPRTMRNHMDVLDSPSLVGDVRLAGFETTWISNTNMLGRHAGLSSIMAMDANAVLTTQLEGRNEQFYLTDMALLPFVDEVLGDGSGNKKFLFLETRGSHAVYRRRVPEDFERFTPMLEGYTPYSPEFRDSIVNAYDNSVFVTDWFLDQLITRLEETGRPATLVYFSDHGERLYEDGETIAHGFRTPRKIEYEVPFFIWQSEARNCAAGKLRALSRTLVNLEHLYEIVRYATCVDGELAENLYDPNVESAGGMFNYEALGAE